MLQPITLHRPARHCSLQSSQFNVSSTVAWSLPGCWPVYDRARHTKCDSVIRSVRSSRTRDVSQGGICREDGGHVLVTEFRGIALNGLFCADVLRPLDLVPSTQPSILLGSVNEYQHWLEMQRHRMDHSDCGWTCGRASKTVKSLEKTCHVSALLRWWFIAKRRYIKCIMHLYLYFYLTDFTYKYHPDALLTLKWALVVSELDYYSSVLAGLPGSLMRRSRLHPYTKFSRTSARLLSQEIRARNERNAIIGQHLAKFWARLACLVFWLTGICNLNVGCNKG